MCWLKADGINIQRFILFSVQQQKYHLFHSLSFLKISKSKILFFWKMSYRHVFHLENSETAPKILICILWEWFYMQTHQLVLYDNSPTKKKWSFVKRKVKLISHDYTKNENTKTFYKFVCKKASNKFKLWNFVCNPETFHCQFNSLACIIN